MFKVSWYCLQRHLRSVFRRKGLASWLRILDRFSALVRSVVWMYEPVICYGRLWERVPQEDCISVACSHLID